MLSFSQCEYFSTITVQLSITLCLQWCFIGYILYCLQLLSPVYLLWCSHVLSFSQCEYFSAHYCTIVYIQCYIESSLLPTLLIIIILPSILTLLFTYAFLFTMRILFHNYYQLTLPVFTMNLHSLHAVLFTITLTGNSLCCLHMLSSSQCDIFPQLLHNSLYNNVYSISST